MLCFLLTSCGIYMQPNNYLPPQLDSIYLQTAAPYDEFAATCKQALEASGIKIVENKTAALYTLHITPAELTHTNLNISSSIHARIYSLALSTTFSLIDAQGKILIPTQLITNSRTITLNPNEILHASNQADIARNEMQYELIAKIFNILRAPITTEQLYIPKPNNDKSAKRDATPRSANKSKKHRPTQT